MPYEVLRSDLEMASIEADVVQWERDRQTFKSQQPTKMKNSRGKHYASFRR